METEAELKHVFPLDITKGERFRKDYGDDDDWEDFLESIRDKGVIQPITVARQQDGGLLLVAGGRRLKAVLELEHDSIPVIIRDLEDDQDLRELELFENAFRKDLDWKEKIALIDEINKLEREKHGELAKWKWSERKLAAKLGLSKTIVNKRLTLAKAMEMLPELKECANEDEAFKKFKKIEKAMINSQLAKQQQEEVAEATKRGEVHFSEYAASHFNIGDAFAGLEELIEMKKEGLGGGIWNLIEIDPPYGINLKEQKRESNDDDALERYTEVDEGEYREFLNRLFGLCYELAGEDCWLVCWYGPTHHSTVKVQLAANGWNPDPIPGIWTKGYGQTTAPNVNLARTYEPFFYARKGKPGINTPGRANEFSFAPVPGKLKFHPTQRPVELMQELIRTFVSPRSAILCPFLGSGVTLRAAYRENCTGMGWDLDPKNKEGFLLSLIEDDELKTPGVRDDGGSEESGEDVGEEEVSGA